MSMESPFGDDFPDDIHPRTKPGGFYDSPEQAATAAVHGLNPEAEPEAVEADARQVEADRSLVPLIDVDGIHLASLLDELSADPVKRDHMKVAIRDKAIHAVSTRAAARTAEREQKLAGEPVTSELDIRSEMIGAADDADVLAALAHAFSEASKHAEYIAAELVPLLPSRGDRPRRSVTVTDGHGFDLKASNTPKTKAFQDMPKIVDVVVASLLARRQKTVGDEMTIGPEDLRRYGEGVRAGVNSILEVIGSPTVKTTALDAVGKELQAMGELGLAKTLAAAYGRKEHGEPTVKIERTPTQVKA